MSRKNILFANLATSIDAITGKFDSSAINEEVIDTKIASLVDGAPGVLDTLDELAAAIGDNPNFFSTIPTDIGDLSDNNSLLLQTNTTTVQSLIDTSIGQLDLGTDSASVQSMIDTSINQLDLGTDSASVQSMIDTSINQLDLGTDSTAVQSMINASLASVTDPSFNTLTVGGVNGWQFSVDANNDLLIVRGGVTIKINTDGELHVPSDIVAFSDSV